MKSNELSNTINQLGTNSLRTTIPFDNLSLRKSIVPEEEASLTQKENRSSFGRGSTFGLRASGRSFTNESDDKDNFDHSVVDGTYLRGSAGIANYFNQEPIADVDEITSKIHTIHTDRYKYVGYVNAEKRKHGFGICYYLNEDKYIGYFNNDKKEGIGKLYIKSTNKTFCGEFKNNSLDGYVEYTNGKGIIHQGIMKNFKFVNKEVMIISHPMYEFEGVMEFCMTTNKLLGVALIKYSNGTIYEGETFETYEHGWGITTSPDGCRIAGQKSEKRPNGYYECCSPNGVQNYGWIENCKKNGVNITITANGEYVIGKYADNFRHGAFLMMRNEFPPKCEIFIYGILVKTIEYKDAIVNYLSFVYPEYMWVLRTNNNYLLKTLWHP